MNENINLCEILKDCPNGTKLYSTLFGEVTFCGMEECGNLSIRVKFRGNDFTEKTFWFKKDGRYHDYPDAECLLFPSKDQRDWSKFKCPKPKFDPKTLQPFDKVLVKNISISNWYCNFFSHMSNDKEIYVLGGVRYPYCIPYNEDTKHLLGTIDEAPEYYRYWED